MVKLVPVNNDAPPVAELYQLYISPSCGAEMLSVTVVPLQVVNWLLATAGGLGTGLIVTVTAVNDKLLQALLSAST